MQIDGVAASTAFVWTAEMVDSFREELEKLVVLDFLIRNTCVSLSLLSLLLLPRISHV